MEVLAHPSPAPIPVGHRPARASVYAMRMYNQRLQILVSKEQRLRLEREAKRRGSSVASVIRDAVDGELGGISRQDRLGAVEAIRSLPGIPFVPPEELNREIDRLREEDTMRGMPDPPDAPRR